MEPQITDASAARSFLKKADELADARDNRGKRHHLPFVLGSVTLAILAGRSKLSSIQRYLQYKIDGLCDITELPAQPVISRAHLPRRLAGVDWASLNDVLEPFFGIRVRQTAQQEGVASEGKTLRGPITATDTQGQRLLLAVTHSGRAPLAQRPLTGPKKSAITATRERLAETGLAQQKVTLDALPCKPQTTAQLNAARGSYLTQVKEKQRQLLTQLRQVAESQSPCAQTERVEKAQGRLTLRQGRLLALAATRFAPRWAASDRASLVLMTRQTTAMRTDKVTTGGSYYLSNQTCATSSQDVAAELSTAIRQHWGVESDNWIRDVTWQEDQVKTKDGNQGQILGSLRTLALALLRKGLVENFQAALEKFTDCPKYFQGFLRQVNFL